MTTDLLVPMLRAADPTTNGDAVPPPERVLRAVEARVRAQSAPRRRPRRAVPAAITAAVVIGMAGAVAVPVLGSGGGPTAAAAIRLAPFDGLMTAYVLTSPPAGTTPQSMGEQGSTTVAYGRPVQDPDAVYVTHSRTQLARPPSAETAASAGRQLADGSWLLVDGYGRFADGGFVTAALATAAPASDPTLAVDLAPTGWRLAAFKGAGAGVAVLTVSPSGTTDDTDAITVIRYPTTAADFPDGYSDRGPSTAGVSGGRPTVFVHGGSTTCPGITSWTVQVRLGDGGSLILLLPGRMAADQVQRFTDGVTVPAG